MRAYTDMQEQHGMHLALILHASRVLMVDLKFKMPLAAC